MRVFVVVVLLLVTTATAYAHDKFPMATTAYRKRVDEKLVRYRERLEARMKEHDSPTKQRDVARKALASLERELAVLVQRYGADDVITAAEADTIKERGKQGRDAIYKSLGFARAKGE